MRGINIKLCLLFSLFLSFSFCITQVQSAFGIKLDVNDDSKNTPDSDANANANANASDKNVGDTGGAGAGAGDGAGRDPLPPPVKAEFSESSDTSNSIDSSNSADVDEEVQNAADTTSSSDVANAKQEEEKEEAMTINEAPVAHSKHVADQDEEKIQNKNENASDAQVPVPPQHQATPQKQEAVVQSGPFIDLLGETLLSLEMVDQTHAKLNTHYTNDALKDKKVIALYFSAGEY